MKVMVSVADHRDLAHGHAGGSCEAQDDEVSDLIDLGLLGYGKQFHCIPILSPPADDFIELRGANPGRLHEHSVFSVDGPVPIAILEDH
jgi:hypothetical protein